MKGKKVGVIAGYVAMVAQNLVSFFLTPFILGVLGSSEFGVYRLVLSITSYFALADLGLSNAIVRYVSEYRAKADKRAEGRFVALILVVDSITGVLIVVAAAVFYRFIPDVFQKSFTGSEIGLLQRLFVLLVFNGVFSLFLNLTTAVMKSHSEFGLLKALEIVRTVVRASLIVGLLLAGYKAFAIVLVDTVLTGATMLLTAVFCVWKLGVRPRLDSITAPYAREVLAYSLVVFVDALAFHLLNSADSIIIGIKISSAAVAVYSIGMVISTLFHSLSVVISDVLMPEVVEKVSMNESNEQLTDYMVKIGRIKLLVLALPTIGFAFLGRNFITLWVGEAYATAFYVALIVIVPSMLAGLGDVGLYVMWAKKKHRIKSLVSLGMAGINIAITIILVERIGIVGAAIGTAFAWTVGYTVFNGVYFQRVLKLDVPRFYNQTFRRTWIAVTVTAAVALLASSIGPVSWPVFLGQVFGVTAVYVGLAWWIALDSSEKSLIRSTLGLDSGSAAA